jgi:hypothetical protein
VLLPHFQLPVAKLIFANCVTGFNSAELTTLMWRNGRRNGLKIRRYASWQSAIAVLLPFPTMARPRFFGL